MPIIVPEPSDPSLTSSAGHVQPPTLDGGQGPQGPPGGGNLFITGVTSGGVIADITYEPGPTQALSSTVIQSCRTNHRTITISFIAEGGVLYAPTVSAEGVTCTNLQQYLNDLRLFYGTLTIDVPVAKTIKVISNSGRSAEVVINWLSAGPDILTCTIGSLPGTQTELKANDTVTVSGTAPLSAVQVQLLSYEAFNAVAWATTQIHASGTYRTFSFTATTRNINGSTQHARVQARDIYNVAGNTFNSSNSVTVNQTKPTCTFVSFFNNYPGSTGNLAFKNNETGTVNVDIANADTVTFSSPTGDFIVSFPTTVANSKTITCQNPTIYNDSVVNYRIVARRIANDSYNDTFQMNIEVAPTAPTLAVTQSATRLRSSEAGTNYTITATSSQNLSVAPQLTLPVDGEWVTGFTNGPKVWTAILKIMDGHAKGSGAWQLAQPLTNKAGVPLVTVTGTQVCAGFMPRNLALLNSQNEVTVGVEVVTFNNLRVGYWEVSGSDIAVERGALNQPASFSVEIDPDTGLMKQFFTVDTILTPSHTFRLLNLTSTVNSTKNTTIYSYEEL